MRLDKFISNNTELSRSQVKRLIKSGVIEVNGVVAQDAGEQIQGVDRVLLDGTPIVPRQYVYFMLHKPQGYVCSHDEGSHPSVLDLLDQLPEHSPPAHELQIVGRLDLDTTGLLLLSNDGQWNHRVTAPNATCCKRYRVTLAEPFNPATVEDFRNGIQLHNEPRPTLPAEVQQLSADRVLISISEGRYHQVRRMFAATGNHVTALHREAVGGIELDPDLPQGSYRPLRQDEIHSIGSGTSGDTNA